MHFRFYIGFCLLALLGSCTSKDKTQEKMVNLNDVSDKPEIKIARLNQAINSNPNNAALYGQRSRLYDDLKKFDLALQDAEKALSLEPNKGEFHFLKAKAQRGLNRLEASLRSAQDAEARDYNQAELYILMGEIHIIIKQYQKAIDFFNKALKVSSFNEYAYFYKGIVYAETKDTTRAISNFQTAIEQAPEFVEPYSELAKINTAQKNFKEAHQYLVSGMRFAPENAFLHYNEGANLIAQHLPDSAFVSFKQAANLDTSMYLATYNLGVIEYNRNKYPEAANYFRKGLPHAAKLPNLYLLLADSYEKSGNRQEALKYYNLVLQKDPANTFAQKGLTRLNRTAPKNGIDSAAKTAPETF